MHGQGTWNPIIIATSIDAFIKILDKFAELAAGREYPVALEAKPMTRREFNEFMDFVAAHSGCNDNAFWGLLVADEEADVGPEI